MLCITPCFSALLAVAVLCFTVAAAPLAPDSNDPALDLQSLLSLNPNQHLSRRDARPAGSLQLVPFMQDSLPATASDTVRRDEPARKTSHVALALELDGLREPQDLRLFDVGPMRRLSRRSEDGDVDASRSRDKPRRKSKNKGKNKKGSNGGDDNGGGGGSTGDSDNGGKGLHAHLGLKLGVHHQARGTDAGAKRSVKDKRKLKRPGSKRPARKNPDSKNSKIRVNGKVRVGLQSRDHHLYGQHVTTKAANYVPFRNAKLLPVGMPSHAAMRSFHTRGVEGDANVRVQASSRQSTKKKSHAQFNAKVDAKKQHVRDAHNDASGVASHSPQLKRHEQYDTTPFETAAEEGAGEWDDAQEDDQGDDGLLPAVCKGAEGVVDVMRQVVHTSMDSNPFAALDQRIASLVVEPADSAANVSFVLNASDAARTPIYLVTIPSTHGSSDSSSDSIPVTLQVPVFVAESAVLDCFCVSFDPLSGDDIQPAPLTVQRCASYGDDSEDDTGNEEPAAPEDETDDGDVEDDEGAPAEDDYDAGDNSSDDHEPYYEESIQSVAGRTRQLFSYNPATGAILPMWTHDLEPQAAPDVYVVTGGVSAQGMAEELGATPTSTTTSGATSETPMKTSSGSTSPSSTASADPAPSSPALTTSSDVAELGEAVVLVFTPSAPVVRMDFDAEEEEDEEKQPAATTPCQSDSLPATASAQEAEMLPTVGMTDGSETTTATTASSSDFTTASVAETTSAVPSSTESYGAAAWQMTPSEGW